MFAREGFLQSLCWCCLFFQPAAVPNWIIMQTTDVKPLFGAAHLLKLLWLFIGMFTATLWQIDFPREEYSEQNYQICWNFTISYSLRPRLRLRSDVLRSNSNHRERLGLWPGPAGNQHLHVQPIWRARGDVHLWPAGRHVSTFSLYSTSSNFS